MYEGLDKEGETALKRLETPWHRQLRMAEPQKRRPCSRYMLVTGYMPHIQSDPRLYLCALRHCEELRSALDSKELR